MTTYKTILAKEKEAMELCAASRRIMEEIEQLRKLAPKPGTEYWFITRDDCDMSHIHHACWRDTEKDWHRLDAGNVYLKEGAAKRFRNVANTRGRVERMSRDSMRGRKFNLGCPYKGCYEIAWDAQTHMAYARPVEEYTGSPVFSSKKDAEACIAEIDDSDLYCYYFMAS